MLILFTVEDAYFHKYSIAVFCNFIFMPLDNVQQMIWLFA